MTDPEMGETVNTAPAAGWDGVWETAEGRILTTGLVLAGVSALALVLLPLWAPEPSQEVIAMSLAHLAFGRAAAMSIGYAQELGHAVVIGVNLMIEVILVLIFYPLFVLGCRRLPMARPLERMITRAQAAAEAHQSSVRRFGALGLGIFVWLPFWMTGPVVGSFIGFLIGLPVWLNLSVVLTGTSIAIVGWALFLFQLNDLVSRWGKYGPVLLVAVLVGVIVMNRLRHQDEGSKD